MNLITKVEPVEIVEVGEKTAEIHIDLSPESPREWDNLGTILHRDGRYVLGDRAVGKSVIEEMESRKDVVCVPVYAYIHSGTTINTVGFSCSWDSGQYGVIYADYETIRKEYGIKRVTKKIREKVREILVSEIYTFDQYLQNDVFGYVVLDEKGFASEDACWGYYGIEAAKEAAKEALTPKKEDKE